MAIALVSQGDSITAGTTGTVTLTPSAGNLLVASFVMRNGVGFTSITDDRGQTWSPVTAPFSAGHAIVGMHYLENCAAGSTTVTLTGSSDTMILNVSEWSGAKTSAALLSFDTATNTAVTTHPHGSTGVSPTAAGQLIVTCAGQSSTQTTETVASGFTTLQMSAGNNRQWWQYQITTGAASGEVGAYTDSSHSSVGIIALFDAASRKFILVRP